MPDSSFKIKIVTEGARDSAGDLEKVGKSADNAEKSATKLTVSKHKLVDAFKKLKAEVPLVGAAIDVIKNPFTALTLVAAFLANRLAQVNQAFEDTRRAVGDGKIGDQIQNIRIALQEASEAGKKFKESLADIEGRAESTNEQIKRLNANMELQLKIEGRIDEAQKKKELAQATTPEEKAAIEDKFAGRAGRREQKGLDFAAQAAALGQFQAQNVVREGVAALPEAQARLGAAAARRKALLELADKQTTDLSPINQQLDFMTKPGMMGDLDRFVTFGFGGEGDRDKTFAELQQLKENATTGNTSAELLRRRANADFEAEQKRFNDLQSRTLGAAEQVRSFSADRGAAVATADALRPLNGTDSPQFDPRAQQAMDNYFRIIERVFGEAQRRIDAISRSASRQSQTE